MKTILAILACAAAATAPLGSARGEQDSPGFRGPARDGHVAGFKAPAPWPKALQKGWQVEVGEGHSTPALVDGKLYVFARQGEEEVTLSLDAATGKELWRDRVPAPFEMNPIAKGHGKGPWSSPTVSDGKVFTFGMGGILSCLDAKTGKIVWRHDLKDRPHGKAEGFLWYGNALSPLVTDGMVIVHAFGPTKGAVTALEAATGNPKWNWGGDEPSSASPILAAPGGKPQIIVQAMHKTVGLAPADGKLLWQVEFKTKFEQNSVTPVVCGDLVILSGTDVGVVAYKVGESKAEPAWQTSDVSMYMSSPVLKGERLYGLSEKRLGHHFCLDAKTGKTLWSGPARQVGNQQNAALVAAGDVLLSLTTGSELVVFEANDKEYKEAARYKVADTPTWAHPVVSEKGIFVKDKTKLTRWSP